MIQLERLRAVNHIIAHENCADGIASALILKDVLPEAKVSFVQYETPKHKELHAEPGLLFADFSPHISRVKEFLDAGTIVLDHHGGPAEAVTREFAAAGLGAFADAKQDPGVSGAVLAYREVWLPLHQDDFPGQNLLIGDITSEFAAIAGVRDTWQTKDPRWVKACEQEGALRFWPWDTIQCLSPLDWATRILAIGPILYRKNQVTVEKCIEHSYRFTSSRGRRVIVFEGLKPSSDVAEKLGDTNDLTIGFGFSAEEGRPKIMLSTRSRGGFHARNLALAHGGGGHVTAAGFSLPIAPSDPNPYELIRRVLTRYELVEDEWARITGEPGFDEKVKSGELIPQKLYDELSSSQKGHP